MTPILVSSSGRSGSTLMMRLLTAHDQIVGRTLFPYETRAAQYYHACTRHDMEHASGQKVSYQNVDYYPFQGNDDRSNGWFVRNKHLPLGTSGIGMSLPYYQFVSTVENKKDPIYFVEKAVGWQVMEEMNAAIPGGVKMILLTRDQRDIFFSIKSFNAKRGEAGRGFGEEQGDEKMFTNLLRYPKNFIEINSKYSSGVINVRYEDIVTDTHATLERIFTDLDISTDKDHIEKIIAQGFAEDENVLNHRTTDDDVTTSVGRWKRNADSEMVAFFDRFYGQLQEAGYE